METDEFGCSLFRYDNCIYYWISMLIVNRMLSVDDEALILGDVVHSLLPPYYFCLIIMRRHNLSIVSQPNHLIVHKLHTLCMQKWFKRSDRLPIIMSGDPFKEWMMLVVMVWDENIVDQYILMVDVYRLRLLFEVDFVEGFSAISDIEQPHHITAYNEVILVEGT